MHALRHRARDVARRPSSSRRSCASATRASRRPARRATSSSPTSRTARAACATSTPCSGSPNTSTGSATRASSCAAGLFTPEEYRLFERCEEFLWRVRCHLHFVTGRAEERLSFDLQPQIAERLGYGPRGGLSGVERFMKAYFLIAKEVGDLTAIVCAALEARHAKRTPVLDRLIGRFRDRFRATAIEAEDFVDRPRPHQPARRRRLRARSRQPDPAVLARRPAQPADPSRRHPARPTARCASSARPCGRTRRPTGSSSTS